jgi:hypothetical protein
VIAVVVGSLMIRSPSKPAIELASLMACHVIEVGRHSDNSVNDVGAKVCLRRLLHFHGNDGGNPLRMKQFILTHAVHDNHRLLTRAKHTFKGQHLDVRLHHQVHVLVPNAALGIKGGILWIPHNLILHLVTKQTLRVCSVRGCCLFALIIGDDLRTLFFPDADSQACCPKINAYSCLLRRGFDSELDLHCGVQMQSTIIAKFLKPSAQIVYEE